jgi:hypothetical protein
MFDTLRKILDIFSWVINIVLFWHPIISPLLVGVLVSLGYFGMAAFTFSVMIYAAFSTLNKFISGDK